jgi:hypothetical protein
MKLPLFIAQLQVLQNKIVKDHGKTPVVKLSSDEEGNSFGDIDLQLSFGYDEKTNTLVIYPIDCQCDL